MRTECFYGNTVRTDNIRGVRKRGGGGGGIPGNNTPSFLCNSYVVVLLSVMFM